MTSKPTLTWFLSVSAYVNIHKSSTKETADKHKMNFWLIMLLSVLYMHVIKPADLKII